MKELGISKKFEQISGESTVNYQRGAKAARLALDLGKTAMRFSRVYRAPRYADKERESDVEHSYMLALVAPEIVAALELDLDIGLVAQFASVHDLIELKTGDKATFLFDDDMQMDKEKEERRHIDALLRILPPHTGNMLVRFEHQLEPEARFVRYIDKLLPIVVDIIGAGKKIMIEDFNISSLEALRICHEKLHARLAGMFEGEFPEIDIAHQLLCELFEVKFASEL